MSAYLKILLLHIMILQTHRRTHRITFSSADQREDFRLVFGMHLVRVSTGKPAFMTEVFVVSIRQMAL